MNYSVTIAGIIVSIALPILVQIGFTDSCANEITAKVAPIIAMLPGAIIAWYGRWRNGDIKVSGIKK